jgi:hypothetical protein
LPSAITASVCRGAAEEVLAAPYLDEQRLTDARVVSLSRQRPHERRTHELALLAFESLKERRDHARRWMMFIMHVRDGPQAIVGIGHDLMHDVRGTRIVERREQHQRAKPHELIFVTLHGFDQRRHDGVRTGAPECSRGGRPD